MGNNIIAVLHKAQAVETSNNPDAAGWIKVEAEIEGQLKQGYVSARLLRDPVSDAKEALIAGAIAEWLRFDKGIRLEHQSPQFRYVGEMWRAIGMNLDGKDRDVPWSAAFISWIVRNAGANYANFNFAAAHARYIHQSIRAKLENNVTVPFWGFKLNEHKVQLGDLICQWREEPITYDQAKNRNAYFSHCDVVVEIDGSGIRALGGNNSHSVRFKTYARNSEGYVKAENQVFAILRNNQ
jgi:hypothetical protein